MRVPRLLSRGHHHSGRERRSLQRLQLMLTLGQHVQAEEVVTTLEEHIEDNMLSSSCHNLFYTLANHLFERLQSDIYTPRKMI
jgi:hypothetical protein